MAKDAKYNLSIIDFPYQNIRFEITDKDNMTFYFDQYIKDVQKYSKTEKVDLNSYHGKVKFFTESGKFLWKVKMY